MSYSLKGITKLRNFGRMNGIIVKILDLFINLLVKFILGKKQNFINAVSDFSLNIETKFLYLISKKISQYYRKTREKRLN